jgi:hypothetical protein
VVISSTQRIELSLRADKEKYETLYVGEKNILNEP